MGIYYVKQGLYEKACQFFERAAQVQPKEVKWQLMVASCYRRSENYQKALKLYEEIYNDYPENMECLRFLVQICQELGLPYESYNAEYMRLKRKQEAEDAKFSDFQNVGDDYMNGAMGQAPPEQKMNGGFEAPPLMAGVDLGGPTRNNPGIGGDNSRVVQQGNRMNPPEDDGWGAGGDDELLPD